MLTCVVRPIVLIASRYVFNLARGAADPPCPNSEKTQVALVQMRCGANPEQNLTRAIEFIREAAKAGAEIICLPELFRSQYFCQSEDHDNFSLAESIPGPSTDALTKLAREKSIVIVASLFEKRAAGVYHNTAVVIDADGNILGKYRKMHIPMIRLTTKNLFYAGRSRFSELENHAWQSRRLRLLGPVVSGSGTLNRIARRRNSFLSNRDRVAPAREEKYGAANFPPGRRCSAATPSRMGVLWQRQIVSAMKRQRGAMYRVLGQSFICAPSGEILAQGSVDREEIVSAEVEWKRVDQQRTHWPFLRDRRVDAYEGIQQRLID